MLYLIIKSKEEGRVLCVSGGQRLYIWLWLPYSTRYYQFRYFCPAKNSKQTASISKQQEYISSSERL